MTALQGKVAVVTGAASGIGRALALELSARGAAVAISDIDAQGLAETASLIGSRGPVSAHALDVRKRDQWARYAAQVEASHGPAHLIINNAGLAVYASVEDVSYEDFELVMDVNFWGVVYGTKTFLPHFRKHGLGHVVNISSVNGMVPFVNQAPYSCSKYGVLGFSETLIQELRGTGIRVTCVHPGGIRTNIVRHVKGLTAEHADAFERIAMTSSESAARQILNGVERDRERVYVGVDSKLVSLSKRLLPALIVHVVGRASGRFVQLARAKN